MRVQLKLTRRGQGRALASAAFVILSAGVARAAQVTPQTLADADRQFARKSYRNALKGYEAAQKAGLVPAERG